MAATVLCVDDDRNLCQLVARALATEGYEVRTSGDATSALAVFRDVVPDLVLLDTLLPGRDGFSVLEEIRGMDGPVGQTPVVLLSASSPTRELMRRAQSLDAGAVLTKPVALQELLETVTAELRDAKEEVAFDDAPARDDGELAGSLETFPFPALLHHLHGLRASGVLHLGCGAKRKFLQIRDGYATTVRSNAVSECLGNFLVRTGRISADAKAESLSQLGDGRRQGEILVSMDALSEEKMSEALREQADEKLFEIFAWSDGEFFFEFGGSLQKGNGLPRRSPANLILRGVRTRFPIDSIDAFLHEKRKRLVEPGESPFYRFQEVALDADQRRWLAGLDGTQRVSDFLHEDEELRRTLYALLTAGLLELRRGEGGRRPTPSPRSLPEQLAVAELEVDEEEKRTELAALAERFAGSDPFQILEVDKTSSEEEVRVAYDRLAERTHPDHVASSSEAVRRLAEQVFRRVADAYEILSDPRRRQEYMLDRQREARAEVERDESRRALEGEMEFQKGETALGQRNFQTALHHFGQALELYPEDGEYHAHYGWTLHMLHPDSLQIAEEAIEHVKRGIKLARDREKPYLFMGRLCKATGRPEAAEKMFGRAVRIQPECVDALRELRLIEMRRRKDKGLISRLLRR
jgi:CheY-like chemotaxis protein